MCKRLAAGLLLLSLALLAPSAAAHPGRTDSDGGHFNRTTGQYHWHHGYSEHQHYDMDGDGKKDCPLTFKGSAASKSSSSSKSTTSSKSSGSSASSGKSFFSIFSRNDSSKKATPSATTPAAAPPPATKPPATVPATTASSVPKPTSTSSALVPLSYRSTSNDDVPDFETDFIYPLCIFSCAATVVLLWLLVDSRNQLRGVRAARAAIEKESDAFQEAQEAAKKEAAQAKRRADDLLSVLNSTQQELSAQFDQEKKILTSRFEQEQAALNAQFDRERANLQKQLEGKQLALQLSAAKRRKLLSVMEETYGKNFLLRAAGAPVSVYFDPKGYPRLSPNIDDDPYILHRSATGKYHRWGCQHYYSCTPVHALDVSPADFRHCSCMVCCPKYPDFAWVDRLNRLVELTKD